MATWEMKSVVIMLQEQWLEMCQRVFLTKQTPYTYLIIYITAVKLMDFHLLELLHKLFVDGEIRHIATMPLCHIKVVAIVTDIEEVFIYNYYIL